MPDSGATQQSKQLLGRTPCGLPKVNRFQSNTSEVVNARCHGDISEGASTERPDASVDISESIWPDTDSDIGFGYFNKEHAAGRSGPKPVHHKDKNATERPSAGLQSSVIETLDKLRNTLSNRMCEEDIVGSLQLLHVVRQEFTVIIDGCIDACSSTERLSNCSLRSKSPDATCPRLRRNRFRMRSGAYRRRNKKQAQIKAFLEASQA